MSGRTARRRALAWIPAIAAGCALAVPLGAAEDRLITGAPVGRPAIKRVVEPTLRAPAGAVRPGQAVLLSVGLDIQPGWHVNSSRPTEKYLIPTSLAFPDPAAAAVGEIVYPEGKMVRLKFSREMLSVYEGSVTLRASVRPPADAAAGERVVPVRVTYQACSDTACLPPETFEFKVALRIAGEPVAAAPGGGTAAPAESEGPGGRATDGPGGGGAADNPLARLRAERGFIVLLGVVFLGGLALNLTPCVYPMLPVTIAFFSGQAPGAGTLRKVALPALYVFGMAVTYSALGVAAGLGGGIFGAALQSPWLIGGLIVLFVAMALWMFGVYELRLPGTLVQAGGGRSGATGALLMGLTMGLVAAPCIGPFIVTLLAFVGASADPILGFWLFFVLAVGMGLPNLVLGVFSGLLAGLPRSGVWLIYAKKVMGVALLAVALYFAQPFLSDRQLGVAALLFAFAAGLYLAFLERTRAQARWFPALRGAVGLAVVGLGAWLAMPLVSARPGAVWAEYSHGELLGALNAGRPAIIDFSAEWCIACRELERYTFVDEEVVADSARFRLLRADLTSYESEPVRQIRERFEIIGLPTVVFLDSRGEERRDLRLFGFEPPGAFLERMRQVR